MAKTSESVSVLIRHALWECVSLALLPVLLVGELIRWLWRFVAKQIKDQ